MTSPVVSLSFIVVVLAAACFTFPIIEPQTSTSIPLNAVEGHLSRAFTNELELTTSTLAIPSFGETTVLPHRFNKKDEGAEDGGEENPLEDTTVNNEEQSGGEQVERGARKIDESNTLAPEVVSTENVIIEVKTTVEKVTDSRPSDSKKITTSTLSPSSSSSSSTSSTKSSEKYVGRYEEEDEKKKEKNSTMKKPSKDTKESEEEKGEKHESEEEGEEFTTQHSSGQVAEYDPSALDTISTPPGSRLSYDENYQSIPRQTTEKSKEKETDEVPAVEKKPMVETITSKTIPRKFGQSGKAGTELNQGEKSANNEEKEPDH